MRRLFYSLLVVFFSTASLHAQDVDVDVLVIEEESTPVTLSGSVDTYFRTNLNARNSGRNIPAPGTSFANLPGFSLGMVNLIAGYEGEKVGFVADLVFGPRGSDAVFASPYYNSGAGTANIINQLYTYWKVSDAVTLTLGNFNTFLGYEVISPTANFNYSTSYMFSYGPFSHTGLKADFALSDEFSLMLAVMNPTDFTEFNPFAAYTLGFQLGYATDAASIYLNALYGDQDGPLDLDDPDFANISGGGTFQIDLTAGFDLSETLFLGLNTTINTTSPGEIIQDNRILDLDGDGNGFYGVAGYLQVSPTETFGIGLRGEYFAEFNGGVGAIGALDTEGDGSVFDLTLSSNINVGGGLTLIPEFRIDIASEEPFQNIDLEAQNTLASFLLAAVYSF
ncbi:MAG: porin [Tunicatimonas sp.]